MGKTWVFSQNPCCALRANPGDIEKISTPLLERSYAGWGGARGRFFRQIRATSSNSGGALFFSTRLFDNSIEQVIDN
jgi:hypothetical protein